MSYKLIWEDNGVKVVFENNLNNSDYLACNEEIISDPRFVNLKYIIRNYLKVTSFDVDANAVQTVASLDAAIYPKNTTIKIAIISDKIITKGLMNMFLIYFEAEVKDTVWKTELFATEDEAEQWLLS